MTDTKLKIAIAKRCLTICHRGRDGMEACWFWNRGTQWAFDQFDPLIDMNAIRSAVLTQSRKFQNQFDRNLFNRELACRKYVHQLTARDWSECFLEAMKEEEK